MAEALAPLSQRDFLGAASGAKVVPVQLRSIFEEVPVDLDTFIKDPRYLNEEWDLSDIQWDAVRMIERVYFPETYELLAKYGGEYASYWKVDLPVKNLIALEWGKGSGKDLVCQIASLRVAYLLLCLKSPQQYFDLPEIASIHMLNIAVNAAQAERAFFDPVRRAVRKKGSFFEGKAVAKRDSIHYSKNIIAISGHSDAESQEGLNIILGVADEIDAFREKDEMVGLGSRKREASTSAESILKMIKGSASTRFPRTYKRVAISYPRYIGSTIQKQIQEGLESNERFGEDSIWYVSGPHPTWDVNPRIRGKEDYAEDYAKDPVEAASMYECRPARAVDGYFKNMPALFAATDTPEVDERGNPLDNEPIVVEYVLEPMYSQRTKSVTKVWNVKFHIDPDFKPKQGAHYAMHGDLAIKGDRAGIAMSHVVRYEDTTVEVFDESTGKKTSSLVRVPFIRNDFTIGLEATNAVGEGEPPREIQIRWARELAFELIDRGFHIAFFSFDQYQSTDSMQMLTDHGIETDRISADVNDAPYKSLKDVAYDGRLTMPYNNLLLSELERLNRNGKKIDHPPGGSKDLADALACSIVGAITAMGEETVDGKEVAIDAQRFSVGKELAPLAGFKNNTDYRDLLPAGMEGMSLYG